MVITCGGWTPATAQDLIPPKAYSVTPGGVNLADRSLVYSVTDLSVGPLKLERFHRTGMKQPNDPAFGANFSNNFDIYVAKKLIVTGTADTLIVHIGNSASGTYSQPHSTTSFYPYNLDAEKGMLALVGGKYVYTDSDGTIYTFSATVQAVGAIWQAYSRRVERIDFPDGRVQSFSYNASGYLKFVEDSSGYAIVFDYDSHGDITAACAFNRSQNYVTASSTCAGAQLKTSYAYTTINSKYYLTSATDVMGQTTSYTNVYGGVTCIKPPGYSSCTLSMPADQIASQTLADGGTWTIGRSDNTEVNDPDQPAPNDGHNEIYLTDPAGKETWLTFTKTSPYTILDANGKITRFKFEGGVPIYDPWAAYSYGSMLREAIYPEGDKYLAVYAGPFRSITRETHVPKPGSGLPNLEKTYGYGSCTVSPGTYQNCAKPLWVKDPKGYQTDFTYASHGGVLTEMKPAPIVGGARPLTVYTYVQKYAYVKNSGGTLVAASTPVWLPATMTVCQTVAGSSPSPVCDSAALQTVTAYEYGANGTANNLLLRGMAVSADGVTLRTCFSYDALGRRISETKPNADLGTCP